MFDLGRLNEEDAGLLGDALATAGSMASSMEEAADKMVKYLYENLTDKLTGDKSCALVRFYKTHSYGQLDPELRHFAEGILGHPPESTCRQRPVRPVHKC